MERTVDDRVFEELTLMKEKDQPIYETFKNVMTLFKDKRDDPPFTKKVKKNDSSSCLSMVCSPIKGCCVGCVGIVTRVTMGIVTAICIAGVSFFIMKIIFFIYPFVMG